MQVLRFDGGLVYQHDRDFVAHRIHALALDTLQPASIFFQNDFGFADGTDENVQQFVADRHGNLSVYQRTEEGGRRFRGMF